MTAGTGDIGASGAISTAASNLIANAANGQININDSNTGTTTISGASASEGAFTLTTAGSIAQGGSSDTISSNNLLTLQAGTNGSIAISANLSGGSVTLNANGSGTITQAASTNISTSGTLTLSSGSGDIGTSGANILTSAQHLTANTAGNVYVTDSNHVVLNASSAGNGDTFNLTSTGSITIGGNVAATSGTIGSINLNSTTINEANGNYVLSANNVGLTSTLGDIGASGSGLGTAILTNAANLTVASAGNAYVHDAANVNLNTSSVGSTDTFNLTSTWNNYCCW
ncbi:MAG: hypothetical protein WDN66_04700 [Candidatus Saccharibacteria bacterium]